MNASCKGLDKKDTFDGKGEKYTLFVKLIKQGFEDIWEICALNVATEWPAVERSLIQAKMVDIFNSSKVSKEVADEHVNLV